LLNDGEFVESGPVEDTLKTSKLRKTFGENVSLRKAAGRYRLKVD